MYKNLTIKRDETPKEDEDIEFNKIKKEYENNLKNENPK